MAVMHESLSPENRATFLGAMRERCAYNPQGLDQYYSSDVLWLLDEIDSLERMLQASNRRVLEQGRTIRGAMQQLRSSGGQKSGADGVLLPVGLPTAMEEGNDGVYHRQTYRDSDLDDRIGF